MSFEIYLYILFKHVTLDLSEYKCVLNRNDFSRKAVRKKCKYPCANLNKGETTRHFYKPTEKEFDINVAKYFENY